MRITFLKLALVWGLLGAGTVGAAASAPATPTTTPGKKPLPGVLGTRQSLSDAWLASDAVVAGTYRGVDSTLGPVYHVVDVDDVWMGSPTRGRVVFKAPRGVRGERRDRMLLFFWDRLAGAPDSFLEESKGRYGDRLWPQIGPDSLAVYLLPFPSYAYPFEKDKLVLRGQGAFPTEIGLDKLKGEMLDFETSLQPQGLYSRADAVARFQVDKADLEQRMEYGSVVERRVLAVLHRLEAIKGQVPDTLQLRFVSVPRSPRFKQGDEVILFLARGPEGLYLAQGKRCVLHVVKGEVLEAGRPLAEFIKTLRGS